MHKLNLDSENDFSYPNYFLNLFSYFLVPWNFSAIVFNDSYSLKFL